MNLHSTSKDLLGQLSTLIEKLTPESYTRKLPVLGGSSIGQHIRHTLEFFTCLEQATVHGWINYDMRKHDLAIETQPYVAESTIQRILTFLDENTSNFSAELHADYTLSQDERLVIPTNYYRELAYNIEHAVHHMAIIKIGVQALGEEITLPSHFGVATSTVRYQNLNK